METLHRILEQAEASAVAIGHFNISDLVALKAVFEAARNLHVPVIVGASEGERQFIGDRQVSAVVKSLRDEHDFPIFLNADHTHSLPSAIAAAKAGFDWIVFDVSTLPFKENVRQTRAAVEELKAIRPDILVEGEIGDIGSGSEIHDVAPDLQRGSRALLKRNSLWKKPGSIHWLLRLEICMECSRAWWPGRTGRDWTLNAFAKSRRRPTSF